MFLKAPSTHNFEQKSLPLDRCLAKTVTEKGVSIPGLTVLEHCRITGLVSRELINRYPEAIIAMLFPEGVELIVSSHDVGKINPMFQAKIYRAAGQDIKTIPELKDSRPELESQMGYHWAVSQSTLEGKGKYISLIAGRHHGVSPITTPIKNDPIIGGIEWQLVREELLSSLEKYFCLEWPVIQDDIQASLISGLTTVADWISSGTLFTNLKTLPENMLQSMISSAVDSAGFIRPRIRPNLTFQDIFKGYTPKPIQQQFIQLANSPGVYIMEALMGEGKTEAALFAAYKMLEEDMASGIYFALPTQLTSEKIYERVSRFLNVILEKEDRHTTLLLHSNSWLLDTDLGEEGRPGYSWFNAKKRGVLAPFAVGTIDQALMAVMNVKHGFVRSFGLAGKVVILDEVHTYDAYTGSIMDQLVKTLSHLGCTVILLSATLTENRRIKLLESAGISNVEKLPDRYPLLCKAAEQNLKFSESIIGESKTIGISLTSDAREIADSVLEKAYEGQFVLWIENTVSDAQNTYQYLKARFVETEISIGLIHSRFTKMHREKLEDHWVEIFGKEGIDQRDQGGNILVGTQVLEQSLDIDADFLVTRLAPTDMILQRIGRLWRHKQNNPYRPVGAKTETVIIVPEDENLQKPLEFVFGGTGMVYNPYVLARSLEVLNTRTSISIPDDLRILIEDTYKERSEVNYLSAAKQELIRQREKLKRFALMGIASLGQTLPESAATRYSEIPTVDVLLLLKDPVIESGQLLLLDGTQLELSSPSTQISEKKEIIGTILKNLISVPHYQAPDNVTLQELSWLRPYIYVAPDEDRENRIRIAILDKSGTIKGLNGHDANQKYNLSYQDSLGYRAIKKEV